MDAGRTSTGHDRLSGEERWAEYAGRVAGLRSLSAGNVRPTVRNDLFKLISISICRLARSAQHLYGTPQIPTLGVRLGRAGLEARGKILGI